MHFDVTLTLKFSPESDAMLAQILEQLQSLTTEIRTMSTLIEELTARVAEVKTVNESAITLIQGIRARLDEALANQPDPAALQQLSDDLAASESALAAAVAANTPAA